MNKIMAIGLDAADEKYIRALMAEGKLKNFAKIIQRGCYALLSSTLPPVTIPAWPAMFSGKNTEQLGAVDFFRLEKDYQRTYLTSDFWQNDMLWTLLSRNGLTNAVINVPGTNPAYPVQGVMLSSDFGAFQTFPDDLQKEIDCRALKKSLQELIKTADEKRILKESYAEFNAHAQISLKLLEKEWNFFTLVIRLIDIALHRGDRDNITQAYLIIDEFLGQILRIAETQHYNLIIASDHGSRKITYVFNVNTFLAQCGYFALKKSSLFKVLPPATFTSALKPFFKRSYKSLRKLWGFRDSSALELVYNSIDWKNTKAFCLMEECHNFAGIWLNSSDTFTNGIITSGGEKERVRKEICARIAGLKDGNGQNIIRRIINNRTAQRVDTAQYLPDLYIEMNPEYALSIKPHREMIQPLEKWIHDPLGIFAACGPDITHKEGLLDTIAITDVAPTILALFNIQAPPHLAGKPVTALFSPNSPACQLATHCHIAAKENPQEEMRTALQLKEDQDIIKERLKKLGYL